MRTIDMQWNALSEVRATTVLSKRNSGFASSQAVTRSPSASRSRALVTEKTFTSSMRSFMGIPEEDRTVTAPTHIHLPIFRHHFRNPGRCGVRGGRRSELPKSGGAARSRWGARDLAVDLQALLDESVGQAPEARPTVSCHASLGCTEGGPFVGEQS